MTPSTLLSRRLRAVTRSDDAGFALITVIGIGFLMTALMLGSLAYAAQVTPQARKDQNWNAALAAAQAGVDDYVSRLNRADSYALSFDCANVAMKGPDAPANTCTWNAGSGTPIGWQPVQSGNPSAGYFHYVPYYIAGSVQLTATGKVGGSYRTLDVRVARGGSKDFLYYTDFEDADPMNKVAYPSGASVVCGGNGKDTAKYWYQSASGGAAPSPTSTGDRRSCLEVQFIPGDVLNGPVHFNDTPLIGADSGTTRAAFSQGFETADPNCTAANATTRGYCYRITSLGTPDVGTLGARSAPNWQLPDNSDQFSNYPGCQYYGDTRIRFNADGTMTVWNTRSAGRTIVTSSAPAGLSCGDASKMTPTSATDPRPGASVAQTVPVPSDGVIYVRNSGTSKACATGQIVNGVTSGSSANDVIPQGTAGTDEQGVTDISYWLPGTRTTTSTQTWTKVNGNTSNNTALVSTTKTSNSTHYTTFNCGQGNVYVEGTLKGRVTLAAENNVVITGDLLLAGTTAGAAPATNHILGLVAGNSVVVYHPVARTSPTPSSTTTSVSSSSATATCNGSVGSQPTWKGGATSTTCTWVQTQSLSGGTYSNIDYPSATTSSGNRWVHASIQTLQHSFWVQAYQLGAPTGRLSVRGSIAQRWRGIVGTGSPIASGYLKDYAYDARLRYQSPPYFPQWTNATWSAATTGELRPRYVGQ